MEMCRIVYTDSYGGFYDHHLAGCLTGFKSNVNFL